MDINDLILVSVDDHVVEPPSLAGFMRDRVAAKFKDRVPKVTRRDDGTDAWLIEGEEVSTFGLNASAGRVPQEWGTGGNTYGISPTLGVGRRTVSVISSPARCSEAGC